MSKPNVLIVGAGGVGTMAALSLTLNNKSNVTLVVRSDYDHVMKHGYSIDSAHYGQYKHFKPANIARSVQEANDKMGPFDFIVLTTKNIPDGPITCEEVIKPAVSPGTAILLIQNGIGIEVPMIEAFPQNVILSGVTLIGSFIINGHVENSHFDSLYIGKFDNKNIANYDEIADAKIAEFQSIYQNENPKINSVQKDDDVRKTRWDKLVYNSVFNTTTTIVNLDVNRCQINNANELLFRPAMDELILIANSDGVEVDPKTKDKFLHIGDGLFYSPSMLVDLRKHQLFELEVILGNPLKIAKKNGVSTPILQTLYTLLSMILFRMKEEKGLITVNKEDYKNKNSDDYPEIFHRSCLY